MSPLVWKICPCYAGGEPHVVSQQKLLSPRTFTSLRCEAFLFGELQRAPCRFTLDAAVARELSRKCYVLAARSIRRLATAPRLIAIIANAPGSGTGAGQLSVREALPHISAFTWWIESGTADLP